MTETSNLHLPYIMPAQAQTPATPNEALRMLDAVVQLAVLARNLTSPPKDPSEGDRYIVASGADGDWATRDMSIAAFQDGAWAFFKPNIGWLVWIDHEDLLLVWNGAQWISATGAGTNPTPLVGINATADSYNRLSINAPASLFNHDGNDHRLTINKANTAGTASVIFKKNFSGRAELGLTGDDNWHVKVSPDGNSWSDSFVVDRNTAGVAFNRPPKLPTYRVRDLPNASDYGLGALVLVSDARSGPTLAFSNGGSWQRIVHRGVIS